MTVSIDGDPGPALEVLEKAGIREADILVTLGSGHSSPWTAQTRVELAYGQLPGWSPPGVPGHHGKLSLARVGAENLLVMEGRHHYYEARSYRGVRYPIVVARALGVRLVVLTNSAGAVRADLRPGELVLIAGHLLLQGAGSPLPPEMGADRTDRECYWEAGRDAIRRAAVRNGIALREGVLFCASGPSYETVSEVAMARALGADIAAMSLAPEAVAAHTIGMRAIGISLVTNAVARAAGEPVKHSEVVAAARRSQPMLDRLLRMAIPLLSVALSEEEASS